MSILERWFRLSAAGTTAPREVVAGTSTFLTLSYIVFVQPAVLAQAGMNAGGVMFATCVASAAGCFLMARLANYPIALAPAMGHNFFFAFIVCGTLGFTWQQALTVNLIAGLLFLGLARTELRPRIMSAIPSPVQRGLAAGIGLLIAWIGLQWGGLVTDSPATLVTLGDLTSPVAATTLIGLILISILTALRVRAAALLGVLGTAAITSTAYALGWISQPMTPLDGVVGLPPAPTTAFAFDFGGLFSQPLGTVASVLLTLLILDLFDTAGTLIGVADRAGLLVCGSLPRAREAFAADAASTTIGACLGTSTVTSYVESTAGVLAGGRTGLTAAVTGVWMLLALFFTPLVEAIGAGVTLGGATYYPLIAPVLIIVGAMMFGTLRDIDWDDAREAIPAFLTVVIIPFSMSITDGIAWGMIAYTILATVTRRPTSPLLKILALIFVLRYVFLM